MHANRWKYLFVIVLLCAALAIVTLYSLQPVPASFSTVLKQADSIRLTDRHGEPLSISYQSKWNIHDQLSWHEIPQLMKVAIVTAEDKRFYHHSGQDWLARINALWQNSVNLRTVRGASTLSEQVIKMIHSRERTIWSRWLEGWEAVRLENNFNKAQILLFYLNQVPYAANRRGIKQAARYYFDRDVDTLNSKELLALAVLVRAPSRLDLFKRTQALNNAVIELAEKIFKRNAISAEQLALIEKQAFHLSRPELAVYAPHFVRFVLSQNLSDNKQLRTTLHGSYQREMQRLLDQRMEDLQTKNVKHGGLLLVQRQSNEILAWVVAGNNGKTAPGAFIDTINSYRQPGSALKPFLYALALTKGWSAATQILDAPLSESVAYGIHQYSNYSRSFYGEVSLREALANSLNIPALKTIQHVGVDHYLDVLKTMGFKNLNLHPDIYGDGLALGTAEVTLFELVQAYSALANKGVFRPLRFLFDQTEAAPQQVFSEEVSSLISNILSDPQARNLEFGNGTVLNLPVQTAVKTGTSNDFRDSWAVGFNNDYIIGAWMGNLNNDATDGLTGSVGPGLLLRSAFSWLNLSTQTQPLFLSPNLITQVVCSKKQIDDPDTTACREDYFLPGFEPLRTGSKKHPELRIRQPTANLHLAVDPRLPLSTQAYEFAMQGLKKGQTITWYVDGQLFALNNPGRILWPIQRGRHRVMAEIHAQGKIIHRTGTVNFFVK